MNTAKRNKYLPHVPTFAWIICLALVGSGVTVRADDFPPGDATRGAQSWADNCARCHNMRDPKEFRDDQWKPVVLHMRVRAGLTGPEARDILAFLQASNSPIVATAVSLPSPATVPAGPADGRQVYTETCIACHGATGKGMLPGVPDFTEKGGRLSQSDDVLLQHIHSGFQTSGSPMAMPPKGGNPNLSDADIQAVLGYLHETFGQ